MNIHKNARLTVHGRVRLVEIVGSGDVFAVKEALSETRDAGMQDFDTALFDLYKSGKVHLEEVLRNADSRANLEARINFG